MFQLPWAFVTPQLEKAFLLQRHATAARLDRWTALPWTMLWLSILRRHWHQLTAYAIFKSWTHFMVIVSPSYLQLLLPKHTYLRHRVPIILGALLSYILHPGGGLYRDAVMSLSQGGLGALNLFVRLVVGSRTGFWLILSFGYQLPPALLLPLHGTLLAALRHLKPSQPFCSVMQTADTQPLFHTIANNLPLVSLMPIDRPAIKADADICNPLHAWIQVGLGFVLPMVVQLVLDFEARRQFVRQHAAHLNDLDRARWLGKLSRAFAPTGIAVLIYAHFMTAFWYYLMYGQLQLPTRSDMAAAYSARMAAAAANGTR